jgi:hypothetical protein
MSNSTTNRIDVTGIDPWELLAALHNASRVPPTVVCQMQAKVGDITAKEARAEAWVNKPYVSKMKNGNSKNAKIKCADGFRMSVQHGEDMYCSPRTSDAECYTEVEVGYPSVPEPLLMEWCEDPNRPTDTVYPYVPSQTVVDVCTAHGGIVEGDLPPGVPYISASPHFPDYLFGRMIKSLLKREGDTVFLCHRLYDRDIGEGAAQRVVNSLLA